MATILVVDDEPPMREVLQAFLVTQDHTVFTAAGGEEALDLCHTYQDEIDVMITDLSMPGINGIQLAMLVKAIRPRIHVVFASAVPQTDPVGQEGLPEDAVFIKKPFSLSTVGTTIQAMLASDEP